MKTRIVGTIVGAALLAFAVSGCNIPEPAPPCLIGRSDNSPYIVHYTKTSAGADCMNYGSANPDYIGDVAYPMDNSYETWNMEKYGPPNGTVKDVAIMPFSLTMLQTSRTDAAPYDPNTAHVPYATGALTGFTVDANGHCSASTLQAAEQDMADYDNTGAVAAPGTGTIKYEISNVVWLADSAHQGGQFGAKLHYTADDGTGTGTNCVADYDVIGLYPIALCATDADCSAVPNIAAGRVSGSGLQPDYPVHCELTDQFVADWTTNWWVGAPTGVCALTGAFPQLCNNCNAQ